MEKILLLVLALSIVCAFEHNNDNEDNGFVENKNGIKQWALLAAGSSGYYNYRHQADVAHAYKILVARGIPKENIIVMMKDDIAHNSLNPTPGVIINKPDGPNVYQGINIDYKGNDVTPKNFLNILAGNKQALKGIGNGRVIESTSNDNVFVNFVDHGGSGVLGFPDEVLHAKDLINALKKLSQDKKYAKLLFYVEACHAGSMFENILPKNTKILVSTAANPYESSFACYCTYKNYPCLGDVYSVSWMEQLDTKIPDKETIYDQYKLVKAATTQSHVQLYGELSIKSSFINQFLGPNNLNSTKLETNDKVSANKGITIDSRDAGLYWIKKMAIDEKDPLRRLKYKQMAQDIEKNREIVDDVVEKLIEKVVDGDKKMKRKVKNHRRPLNMKMLDCYTNIYKQFSQQCFNMNKNPYVLSHFYKFANLCHIDLKNEQLTISTINNMCDSNFPQITQTL